MIRDEEVDYIFSDLTTERRNVEFKQSMNWDDNQTKFKITKSVLAFSNSRDGGYLVIGVNKVNNHYDPVGMSRDDFNSFNNFDDILAFINGKAEPPVSIERMELTTPASKRFFIIKIKEFEDYPIVCKNGGGNVLNKGVVYVRTKRIPETAPLDNQTNLKEIVDMILTKHGQELYKKFQQLNSAQQKDNGALFDQELGGL